MYQRCVKRIFDIVLSLVGLIVLAIPMLVFALIVKLDSPGPVLFWQKRVGIHKKTFMMPKFRTMYTDTPANMLRIDAIRRDDVPGIHTVTYDSPADMISITHSAHTREGFALGAVLAAEFLATHSGWQTIDDLFTF